MMGMSTNAQNRRRTPAGVPAGGQFATERRGESSFSTLHAQPVGDQIDRNGLLAGDSLEYGHDTTGSYAHYRIDREGDWTYRATGVVDEPFFDAIPEAAAAGLDDEGRLDYLHDREHVIDDFLQERYGDRGEVQLHMSDDPEVPSRVEFSTSLDDLDEITEEAGSLSVWEGTRGHTFYDEMDPGTAGAENAQRLLRERLAAHDAGGGPGQSHPSVPARPIASRQAFNASYYAEVRRDAVLRCNLARAVAHTYPNAAEIVIGRPADTTDDSIQVAGVLDSDGSIVRTLDEVHTDAVDSPQLADALVGMQAHGSWSQFEADGRWAHGLSPDQEGRLASRRDIDHDVGLAVVPISDGQPGSIPPKHIEPDSSDPFFADANDGADMWAPVWNEAGTGYRRDRVTIDGVARAVDASEQAKIDAIAWQEDRARARGELD
jgi:hypothetical protein